MGGELGYFNRYLVTYDVYKANNGEIPCAQDICNK